MTDDDLIQPDGTFEVVPAMKPAEANKIIKAGEEAAREKPRTGSSR